MKFKAILMDNDGTLMDFEAAESNAIHHILDMLEIHSQDAVQIYKKINARCWEEYEKGLITQSQLKTRRFQKLMAYYKSDYQNSMIEEIAEIYENILSQQDILLPGALKTVRKISKRLPIIILTNGIPSVQRRRIEHSKLMPYLSDILISAEVSAPKPNPDIYFKALDLLDKREERENVLMIGDSLSSDIQGAINAGIPNCWYNPEHKTRPQEMKIDFEIDQIEQWPKSH